MSSFVPLLLSAVLVLGGCTRQPEAREQERPPEAGPYAFDRPDVAVDLDDDLDEISGLTVLADGRLAAVQDEDGIIYVLDPATGAITQEIDFEGDGDYEGIERVGEALWVLRSDGTLFEVTGWDDGDPDVDRHETDLDEEHDTEGLAYDAARRRLLIACKEYPGKGLKGQRAIYAFDLDSEQLAPEPAFLVDMEAVGASLGEHPVNRAVRGVLDPLVTLRGFKPSAVALHPGTREVYVLSSVQKVVVVLAPDGALRAVWPLPDALFAQPEGLALLPDGTLFIASEGDGQAPMLFRFSPRGGP